MKLIIGKINASNTLGYWRLPQEIINKWNLDKDSNIENAIGNYAIVNNKNDYDLVKIIGIIETNEKYEQFLLGKPVSKEVKTLIVRSVIRED